MIKLYEEVIFQTYDRDGNVIYEEPFRAAEMRADLIMKYLETHDEITKETILDIEAQVKQFVEKWNSER